MMDMSSRRRLAAFHADQWIDNPHADAVINEIEFIKLMAGRKARPFGIAITKDSGGGKSAILDQFDLREANLVHDKIVPRYTIIEMPDAPKASEIKEVILKSIGSPVGKNASNSTFERILSEGNYKMIIIDEFHNLLSTNKTQLSQCLTFLKWTANTCNVSFILVGTDAITRVFEYDGQFANRFRTVRVPDWKNDIIFKKFIAEYLDRLPIEPPKSVPAELFDVLISCGSLKRMIEVLCQAAYEADKSDELDKLLSHVKKVAKRSGYITK